ncbi:unnamed protein product [Dicrocoelium dendriticum]|nr:unnamed protein product [Dicrocoelium dendriticum]
MMFGDDIVRSLFNTSFFEPSVGLQQSRLRPNHGRETSNFLERCSIHPARDVFTEVSRAIDNVFEAATRSMFNEAEMFSRHFGHGFLRDLPHIPPGRRTTGLGETANRLTDGTVMRSARHTNNEPVHMERSRLQWYDSNTRRALVPPPAPTRGQPCGRLTDAELSKLPLSVYRIRPKGQQDSDGGAKGRSAFQPTIESSPIPVAHGNNSSLICSPGSAYLQPVSRTQGLVEIQPILSSPARGQPECEVCLTEYREKDQLRHLPCGHAFHSKCIDAWFMQSSTCPKCRAGVRTGLKRLERNCQRTQSVNRSTGGAPVRAIRQRSTTVVRAPSGKVSGPSPLLSDLYSRTTVLYE